MREKTYNKYYKEDKEWENATRDEPSTLWFIPQTDPFKVPAITTEEFEKGPWHDEGTRKVSCGNHEAQSCAECPQVI